MGHNPPYRFFPCCAETACSRLMKLSDFSPPKGDWVATVEDRGYEAVYRCFQKNDADFLSAPFMGKSWEKSRESQLPLTG